ncbi:hypothetical protein HPP92_017273 [Vanilla planifolia]|uniref:Uncharacterized protein n=1 Tax=Vanilla planifolia TaxID=51239 RepID=A0A835UQV5_VANPL|nr:hypothetical protein HPP92_017273 [Vanilla planifolia]
MSVITILFVSLLASTARGIRWEGHHVVASTHKVSSKEGYLGEEKVQCRVGEPCPGRNRKALMVKTSREIVPPSSSKSNDKKQSTFPVVPGSNGNGSPLSEHEEDSLEGHPNMFDIARMDYSPAKGKSPIHN